MYDKNWMFTVGVVVLIITIIAAILLIIFQYISGLWSRKERFAGGSTISYFRISDSLFYDGKTLDLIQAMNDNGTVFNITPAIRFKDATFVLFETLNIIDTLMNQIDWAKAPNVRWVYGLAGTDMMVSKNMFGLVLKKTLGDEKAALIIPKTYIIADPQDFGLIFKNQTPSTVYIMKKNIQRQEGYYMSNDMDEILKRKSDQGYVVVQEMLQNPYLIGGRKINMRVYLLVVIGEDGKSNWYAYNDGFMYYTPKPFRPYSTNPDEVITTGYIDRQIYKDHPLTFKDLAHTLGADSFTHLFNNIMSALSTVKTIYAPLFEAQNKPTRPKGAKFFLIYGADIAPDNRLNVTIMEINKGPDLTYKDDRDKEVKLNMVREALEIVNMGARTTSNFVPI